MVVEQLENRRLLSSSLDDGLLTIRGTKGADTVNIQYRDFPTGRSLTVTLNGRLLDWFTGDRSDRSFARHVVVRGRAGDDDMLIRDQPLAGSDIRLSVHGGPGDDIITVKGINFISRIHGGGGDDIITAFPHNRDTVLGGAGDDLLQSYSVSGEPGDRHYVGRGGGIPVSGVQGSIFVGGDGDDTLIGSIYDDLLVGGEGMDALLGDAGKDTLKGGAGSDCYLNNVDDACTLKKRGNNNVLD